jgi:GAF domain-containing protein
MIDENASKSSILLTYAAVYPGSPEETTLRLLVDVARRIVGADEGSLLVLDAAARELIFAMTTGSRSSEETLIGQRVPLGAGITGLAVHTKEVQTGAPTYKDIKQTVELEARGGPQTVIAAPMLAGDDVVGAITAVSLRSDKRFTAADVEFFGEFGAIAGILIRQRQHIDSFDRLAAGDEFPRHMPPAQLQLIRSVSNIARISPDRVEATARLLDAVEALLRTD